MPLRRLVGGLCSGKLTMGASSVLIELKRLPAFCLSMIFSENRFPLFGIMLYDARFAQCAAMSLLDFILLAAAGFLSGVLNALAGGGTFFTFAALLAVGLPPITANASSAVALAIGSAASAAAYRRELARYGRAIVGLALASGAGALIGALILIALDNVTFRAMIPWLLLFATIVFALGPRIAQAVGMEAEDMSQLPRRLAGIAIQVVTAIYGGFFGAGMGFLMLASLGLTEGTDYHRINAVKVILAVVIQSVAIVVFIRGGVIHWPAALTVMVAAIAGGYLGVGAARKVPSRIMRGFVIASGAALTAYYFVSG
jgi:uncharacterized membrane protein YfcA